MNVRLRQDNDGAIDLDVATGLLNQQEVAADSDSLISPKISEAAIIEEPARPESATDHLVLLIAAAIRQWKEDMGMQHMPDRLVLNQALSILSDFEKLADIDE